jgi:hypothetical protein
LLLCWCLVPAVAIGMKGAGMFGENIDKIANEHS